MSRRNLAANSNNRKSFLSQFEFILEGSAGENANNNNQNHDQSQQVSVKFSVLLCKL